MIVEEREKEDKISLLELVHSSDTETGDLVVFSFADIVTSTNNFIDENKLGQGGFGPVYKVFVSSHTSHIFGTASNSFAVEKGET